MALTDTARMVAQLDLDDRMSKGLRSASKNVGVFERGIGRAGKGVGQLGAGIARSAAVIGAATVTGLGFVAKAAIDFEDAFAGVRKTVDASEEDLDALALSFRQMATEIPIAATEFARIGELGGALGVPQQDLEEFVRTVALIGVTTNVSTDDAATALGQLQNVIGLTGDEFDNFAASLVDLGNKGASTEAEILEIARRSGGAAKLIGVAKDETLGWSAAVANLGLQPELAGTALQRFFQQSLTIVSEGGGDLREFAKTAGLTAKAFKKAFNKDAGGALQRFIKGLSKLPKEARLKVIQDLFGKQTGLTRTILGLAESYDRNLSPSIQTASKSWADNIALTEEARKRFATVRSSIDLLRNNLVEAALTIGGDPSDPKSFIGAIGAAAQRLSEFLKSPANRRDLENIGKQLGAAINSINWGEVVSAARGLVDVLKDALTVAKVMWDGFNALPVDIKKGIAAFLLLDKASGGLLHAGAGNVVGGLAETIARTLGSKLPGAAGKLFVQPVLVTNWPPGFGVGGGAAGAAKGGLSALSKVFLVGEAIGLALLVEGIRNDLSDQNTKRSQEVLAIQNAFLKTNPSQQAIQSALDGVNQGIKDLQADPLQVLVQGDALRNLQAMKADLEAALKSRQLDSPALHKPERPFVPVLPPDARDAIKSITPAIESAKTAQVSAVDQAKAAVAASTIALGAGIGAASAAQQLAQAQTKATVAASAIQLGGAIGVGAAITSGAVRGVPPPIVGAVWGAARANRPNISVRVNVQATHVTKAVTIQERYGRGNGSYGTSSGE